MKKSTALITGASSGIGLEMAKILAAKGVNLVLVARRESTLKHLAEELQNTYSIDCKILARDLSKPDTPAIVFQALSRMDIEIDILINNAGFGDHGEFRFADWATTAAMIDLNVKCLTALTHLFLPNMLARKQGQIMNVASTAAFQPGPLMAVYFATKAYVLHFSEALAVETKGTGVTVTALCPGPTSTAFVDVASMGNAAVVKNKKLPTPSEVAAFGIKAMNRGKRVAIHGGMNRFLVGFTRFLPRKVVTQITSKLMKNK